MQTALYSYHGELTVNPCLQSDAALCRHVLLGSVFITRDLSLRLQDFLRGLTKT